MNILSEMPTGIGGRWVLVKYEDDFYAYGYEQDLHTLSGFPIDQCGTKEEVLTHCKSIIKLCNQNIEKYQNELERKNNNPDGWKLLIEHEQKELEALTKFANILLCCQMERK